MNALSSQNRPDLEHAYENADTRGGGGHQGLSEKIVRGRIARDVSHVG